MVALWAAAIALHAVLAAQESVAPVPPPLPQQLILLARAKQHMREVLLRQPNYTCQMSIERSRRRNPRRGFELVDQLRLEVALIDGKESFSWPGARKFDERELREMVGGTSSTGSFALHARAVFFGNAPRFTYLGPRTRDGGRLTHVWRFDVAQMQSAYVLRVGVRDGSTQQATVSYRGEVAIEDGTLDMVSLFYTAEEIPAHLGLQSTADTIRYERLRIGEESHLLPVMSDLQITADDGTTNRNVTRFHNCRQYAGESVISFDEPPAEGAPPPAAPQPIPPLPAGLSMEADLEAAVAHPVVVGNPIRFILTRPARRKGITYLPKATVVHARLVRSGTIPGRVPFTYYTLLFEQIEVNGVFADIPLRLDDVLPPQIGTIRQAVLGFEPTEPTPKPGHFTVAISGNRPELRKGLRLILSVAHAPAAAPAASPVSPPTAAPTPLPSPAPK